MSHALENDTSHQHGIIVGVYIYSEGRVEKSHRTAEEFDGQPTTLPGELSQSWGEGLRVMAFGVEATG